MQQRVACQGRPGHPCGAHRDLGLSPRCFVCGSVAATPVRPSVGDCYAGLVHWAGALVDLNPTIETLAIVNAIGVGARAADVTTARRP